MWLLLIVNCASCSGFGPVIGAVLRVWEADELTAANLVRDGFGRELCLGCA